MALSRDDRALAGRRRIGDPDGGEVTSGDGGRLMPTAPPALPHWVDLPARLLMSVLFLLSGFGKLTAVATTQAYMAAHGIPGVLLWPAAALELGGGLLLLLGLGLRPLGVVLAGWCLITALIFHTALADQDQMINFLKNLAMAGGFLLLAARGAPTLGLDGLIASRRIPAPRHLRDERIP